MYMVALTALGVGGATVLGAAVGFFFRDASDRICGLLLSFAAGIMLAAAVLGLILPAIAAALVPALAGILLGALAMAGADRLVPKLYGLAGFDGLPPEQSADLHRVLLFVLAIALHNFPEGLAAGVSFGCDSPADAALICGGIALQNIPEGMVIIPPMLRTGMKPGRVFLWALGTGLCEVVGTFVGYAVIASGPLILPPALGFAGGTMLFIICDEMIPDASTLGHKAALALVLGFCLLVVCNAVL